MLYVVAHTNPMTYFGL